MRSLLLTGIIFLGCSSFLNDGYSLYSKTESGIYPAKASNNFFDFTAHRLSGDRVVISWHTENESEQVHFEVMRKHGKNVPFSSLGSVVPKSTEDKSADYSFVDINTFSDSSFYCLKKTDADSIVFFSATKGVEGIGKDR